MDRDPLLLGFWYGLRLADGRLPPNPYLNPPERTDWHAGFIAGRRLARTQHLEAEAIATKLAVSPAEEPALGAGLPATV